MLTGLYIAGEGWAHRARPLYKILTLVSLSTLLFFIKSLPLMAACLCAAILLYISVGFTLKILIKQVKPIWFMVLIIFAVQVWLNDIINAALISLRLCVLVAGASLVTLTTKTSDMLEGLEAMFYPLRSVLPTERISLAISLTLRFIPMLYEQAKDVREAQEARGLKSNIVAMIVPMMVRTLKSADEIADAMEARGYDSEPSR